MPYRSDIEQAVGRAIAKGDFRGTVQRLAELTKLLDENEAKVALKAARRLMSWMSSDGE